MFIRLSCSQEVVTRNLNGEDRKLLTLEKATKILVFFFKRASFSKLWSNRVQEELQMFIRYSFIIKWVFFKGLRGGFLHSYIGDFENWI